ncbi:NYN domain-containing protein [Aurantibacillus circumpalustris]|uniref:NYN domain-containing protein n=1 Tax=Aurantibacillus circumpalustris TaxID=3036359 RepID=UPI00295ADD1C|nr:NYN domain-containing protein [Aurantibacillus circumpalustris]
MITENYKIAVLIDGDNAEANLIDQVLNEASKFGRVTVKRIYGDFTTGHMNNWKDKLNSYAIRPIQKFAYTKGKNSTDTALIIDAMDILHSKLVDGFCIVSSDSDYTGIAHRMREEGLFVMGIGKSHTPEAFVKACDNFTYTEILAPKQYKNVKSKENKKEKQPRHKKQNQEVNKVVKSDTPNKLGLTNLVTKKPIDLDLIDSAFEMVYDDMTGQALASQLGAALKKVDPTFDIRNYGHSSLGDFLQALTPHFEIVSKNEKNGQISIRKGKAH